MSSNLEVVRGGYEHFKRTGELPVDIYAPDFVWDMSHFAGWPEDQLYHGVEGALAFLAAWTAAWEDWELELESLHEIGEQVLAIVRQRGRSKSTSLPVEMTFGMLWTVRDKKQARMEMYADPAEAMRAASVTD
jgi:ketosteroid isomerase-like protein